MTLILSKSMNLEINAKDSAGMILIISKNEKKSSCKSSENINERAGGP